MLDSAVIECGDRAVDVSAETSARLTCDAAVVVMQEDAAGAALDVGRKTRTVPPAIRRALEARDTGCRFPGCTARRCDAHHVVHWADGGPTSLDNLVLLCRRHHRLLHEGGYTVHPGAGRAFTFVSARGRVIEVAPPAPVWSERASNAATSWSARSESAPPPPGTGRRSISATSSTCCAAASRCLQADRHDGQRCRPRSVAAQAPTTAGP